MHIQYNTNNKLESKDREAVKWQLPFVTMFICIHAVYKLSRNQKWNHFIDKYEEDCIKIKNF